MEQNESTPTPIEAPTMELLSEHEKAIIDDCPDKTLNWLFNNILGRGIPEWVSFITLDKKTRNTVVTRIEGTDKVLAMLDYVDYLVDNGIRKDPYE